MRIKSNFCEFAFERSPWLSKPEGESNEWDGETRTLSQAEDIYDPSTAGGTISPSDHGEIVPITGACEDFEYSGSIIRAEAWPQAGKPTRIICAMMRGRQLRVTLSSLSSCLPYFILAILVTKAVIGLACALCVNLPMVCMTIHIR